MCVAFFVCLFVYLPVCFNRLFWHFNLIIVKICWTDALHFLQNIIKGNQQKWNNNNNKITLYFSSSGNKNSYWVLRLSSCSWICRILLYSTTVLVVVLMTTYQPVTFRGANTKSAAKMIFLVLHSDTSLLVMYKSLRLRASKSVKGLSLVAPLRL